MTTSATVSAAVGSVAPVRICGRVARELIGEAQDTYFAAVNAEMSAKVKYEAAKVEYEAAIAVEIDARERYHAVRSENAAYASA